MQAELFVDAYGITLTAAWASSCWSAVWVPMDVVTAYVHHAFQAGRAVSRPGLFSDLADTPGLDDSDHFDRDAFGSELPSLQVADPCLPQLRRQPLGHGRVDRLGRCRRTT